ncbi:MAG: 1,4-alpha-glucan branching protein GlgB [Gammaproteobacteria bacterium]|nr:1,4-alpha-glucan branching protein GlgB [Gammaproteobacteria bacterium]MDH5617799.1 1,4-alpha-glucan branching protein GlgB [Gammaproteobacteria bacterium]
MSNQAEIEALATGRHNNPFAVLGLHRGKSGRVVRTLQPGAKAVDLVDGKGNRIASMRRIHDNGLFEAPMPARKRRYALKVTWQSGEIQVTEDPYRFPSTLGEMDLYLLGEGSDKNVYRKLGAHPKTVDGVDGTRFAVWAPNASRVSVVGDFNSWDGRRHVMRLHPGNGIWEIFLPGVGNGALYKYEITDANGALLPLKADPYGTLHEPPPGNSSIVFESDFDWQDDDWLSTHRTGPKLDAPTCIYEVHLGSWRRKDDGSYLSYRDLANELVPYVAEMGFTHIELLPVTEHPFDGSWGYQPIGMFAPTQRFGTPDDFRAFVDACHAQRIGVIMDWVPAHFPNDEHGLRQFDGTALYEHADPRKGAHADWGTLIFNYGRREVINYLIGNALYWIDEFHIDALRVDAVASMLYLDYSREDGAWVPNEFGGNENLEAVAFLKRLNTEIHAHGATSYAEESTAWPSVSRPVDAGGLGFTYKWNMGWMNDTLSYMSEDPVHRKYHHDKMTFGLVYAFNENFVLPLSHDEVVHGKRSILGRMPGDRWQQLANLRAYYGAMYSHPGKKLLFMGNEIAQDREWNHDQSLDWHLLNDAGHRGVQALLRDLNHLYAATPALHEIDFDGRGFEWIDWNDRDSSVLSWLRRDSHGAFVVSVTNLTPLVRANFKLGVPEGGNYRTLLNTDDKHYGGSGAGPHVVTATNEGRHGRPFSIELTLPPLATLYLEKE